MRSIIGVCTSPPEAERRLVQDARVSVDLGKGREGYTQREREREREMQDHKTGERRPPTIVSGVRARGQRIYNDIHSPTLFRL